MMIRPTLLALLFAAPALAQPADNPMAMATGAHIKAVCSRQDDRASRLVCLSWINGASQGNGWFAPRDPAQTPGHCPPQLDFDIVATRDIVLKWLKANPDQLGSPAMVVFARAMAARYPCKPR